MSGHREPPHRPGSTTPPDLRADRSVHEAEAVVHQAWQDQLSQRRTEMEAALDQAVARCDAAVQVLAAARHGGDLGQIATALADLGKALDAAGKASVACYRICRVLGAETDASGPDHDPGG